jgi:choline-sulfatase
MAPIHSTTPGRTRLTLLGALVVAGLFVEIVGSACRSQPGPRNVLLISIDTLRADYLSSYGFAQETTPNIDALAASGTRFENVISPVPLTLPAHSSMLTGMLPTRHGIHDNLGYRLSDEHTTLAELLRTHGFATGAIVSSFVLDSQFNLSQGFDSYDDAIGEEHKIAYLNERKGDETTDLALRFLQAHRDEAFFLWVHYYDPHDDYDPPEPFRSRFGDDLYAGEVAFADEQVGRLVAKLSELELDDSTLVIVAGDHGEMLGEHEESTHGFFVYQSAIRVPLVFRWPGGVTPGTVSERVGLIDIVPTIAGLLGIAPPEEVQGRDLSSLLRGGETIPGSRRELYVESLTANRYYGARPLFGLLTEEFKYILTTRPELYDLSQDPHETTNVIGDRPRIAAGMKARLSELLAEGSETDAGAGADEKTRRRLASLGYLSSHPGKKSFDLEAEGDDPKDWIAFYGKHQRLEKLTGRGEYDEARRLAGEMLEEKPSFAPAHLQLARIATAERDLPLAREHYEKALAIDPSNPGVHFNLGNILAELGDYQGAIERFRAAVTLDPEFSDAKARLELLLRKTGRLAEAASRPSAAAVPPGDPLQAALAEAARKAAAGAWPEAESALRRALELAPESGEAHYRLANLLAAKSQWKEAVAHFQRALEAAPSSAEVHHRLALALRETGAVEPALEHLREAARLAPDSAPIQSDLGRTLKQLGRPDEAITHFEKALELDPRLADTWNDLGSLQGSRGRVSEAIESFRHAVATDPAHAVAQNNLGLALLIAGERDEALDHFQRALELRPEWPVALREVAWLLATHPEASRRNPDRAVQLATRAAELTSEREPLVLDALAAAYAAQGRFDRAVETAEHAIALAETRVPALAAEIRARLELYQEGKPFREPATTGGASPRP